VFFEVSFWSFVKTLLASIWYRLNDVAGQDHSMQLLDSGATTVVDFNLRPRSKDIQYRAPPRAARRREPLGIATATTTRGRVMRSGEGAAAKLIGRRRVRRGGANRRQSRPRQPREKDQSERGADTAPDFRNAVACGAAAEGSNNRDRGNRERRNQEATCRQARQPQARGHRRETECSRGNRRTFRKRSLLVPFTSTLVLVATSLELALFSQFLEEATSNDH